MSILKSMPIKSFHMRAETFICRLLSHVPEKGTHLVRSYGVIPIPIAASNWMQLGLNWGNRHTSLLLDLPSCP